MVQIIKTPGMNTEGIDSVNAKNLILLYSYHIHVTYSYNIH